MMYTRKVTLEVDIHEIRKLYNKLKHVTITEHADSLMTGIYEDRATVSQTIDFIKQFLEASNNE